MNKDGRRDEQEGENSPPTPNIRELNCAVMAKLRQYNAQQVSDSVLRDKNGDADRIRYVFDIPERDASIDCFRFFCSHNKELAKERHHAKDTSQTEGEAAASGYDFPIKEQMKIYL